MKQPLSCLKDHMRVFLCKMLAVTVENLSNIGLPWCRRLCIEVEMAPDSSGKADAAVAILGHLRLSRRTVIACEPNVALGLVVPSRKGQRAQP